jgi:hypothetical protein
MVHLVQTMYLSCAEIKTFQTDRNGLPLDLRHLGVAPRVPIAISEPMIHSAQTVHLSCIEVHVTETCTCLAPILTLSPKGPKQMTHVT